MKSKGHIITVWRARERKREREREREKVRDREKKGKKKSYVNTICFVGENQEIKKKSKQTHSEWFKRQSYELGKFTRNLHYPLCFIIPDTSESVDRLWNFERESD